MGQPRGVLEIQHNTCHLRGKFIDGMEVIEDGSRNASARVDKKERVKTWACKNAAVEILARFG